MNGCHAIIECYGTQSHLNLVQLEELMREAAEKAGATQLGINVHDFGKDQGKTGVLILAESHISVHTWPEDNYAAFDVFMCGRADVKAAADHIVSHDPKSLCEVMYINRGNNNSSPLVKSKKLNMETSHVD